MTVEMQKVKSSHVHAVGYDATAQELHVQYHTRQIPYPEKYVFEGVPAEIAKSITEAESVGKALASKIKGKFTFHTVRL